MSDILDETFRNLLIAVNRYYLAEQDDHDSHSPRRDGRARKEFEAARDALIDAMDAANYVCPDAAKIAEGLVIWKKEA